MSGYLGALSCYRILSSNRQLAFKKGWEIKPRLSVTSTEWAAMCAGSSLVTQTILVSRGFRPNDWLLHRPQARTHHHPILHTVHCTRNPPPPVVFGTRRIRMSLRCWIQQPINTGKIIHQSNQFKSVSTD